MDKARRYNTGKPRYELIPTGAMEKLADVYTKGAEKYTIRDEEGKIIEDGSNNWRKGLSWMSCMASVQRHIEAFKKGEDLDPEIGTYHLANAAWGLFTILEYYKIYPEGDDRQLSYLATKKIGLDIDEVLCNWTGAWCEKFGYPIPTNWHFSYSQRNHFQSFTPEELDKFYLSIPRKIEPSDIPFEPHCYITSRSVPVELTQQWLQNNGFPTVPVYSVGFGKSKVEVAKQSGITYFVDDSFANFVELNNAGICTFLWDAPHNRQHNVGNRRIKSLKELV